MIHMSAKDRSEQAGGRKRQVWEQAGGREPGSHAGAGELADGDPGGLREEIGDRGTPGPGGHGRRYQQHQRRKATVDASRPSRRVRPADGATGGHGAAPADGGTRGRPRTWDRGPPPDGWTRCACYAGGSGAAATDQDSTTRLIHVIRSSHVMNSPRGTKPSLAEAEAGDPRRSLC